MPHQLSNFRFGYYTFGDDVNTKTWELKFSICFTPFRNFFALESRGVIAEEMHTPSVFKNKDNTLNNFVGGNGLRD